jgi:uncharacterized phage protein (TIGR02218 family)
MSYDAVETSEDSGQPFEMYVFQTQTKLWRLTNSLEIKVYSGNNFTPEAISSTEPTQNQELKSGEITVSIPRDHEIAEQFRQYLPNTPMFLTVYRKHESDSEVAVVFTGKVNAATFGDDCELSCVPEQQVLKKQIPAARYQAQCNRVLYDAGCTVARASFKTSAVIASMSTDGTELHATAFDGPADGWFNNGYLELNDQRRMIVNHVGDQINILSAMTDVDVGTHVDAFAGCKRNSDDCANKFSNLVNFFGWEWIPKKNPFKDGVT